MNRHASPITRRAALARLSAGALGLALPACAGRGPIHPADTGKPKSVAAVITLWVKGSHTDVTIGKILDGWNQDGGPGPNLKLASMYLDQFPEGDLSRDQAKKHGVPIFDTIEGAVTVGTSGIPVDGVLCIGEHGDYPWNEKQQHLYPRRRFFAGITDAFEKYDRVVPVFHDKHFGPEWEDLLWMWERAQELNIPLLAGSSLPVSFRKPDVSLPMGSEVEGAVAVGYSGLDIYGFHTLELYQTFVERRRGGETGIEWVQWFGPEEMWKVVDSGVVRQDVVDAVLAVTPKAGDVTDPRKVGGEASGLFLFQHTDGLTGAVFMLQGYARGCSVAVKVKGQATPIATLAEERPHPRHPHFAYLMKAIEQMIHTGKPAYPAERTFLTSGILDRALTSRFEAGKKLATPELAVGYTAVDYPHAPRPLLTAPVG